MDRYFAAGSIEECRGRLMRAVERGDGPALLVGAPGMGKTMLLSVLAESLDDHFEVVSIASTQLCTRRALLQAILFGLGMPYHDREEGELRLALVERLQNSQACPNGAVLLIDEAQALPVRLLEELRVLTNLARDGHPLVRLVLAGAPSLEEQFASTELESFNQRLAARCYLAAFNYGDTLQYVRAHVAAAGGEFAGMDDLFDADALDSVFAASDGVPRLINQVCDRAIVMAVEQGKAAIDQQLVQAAWSDLHQLAAPWHTPEVAIAAPESSVVEFGVLAGADDEGPSTELAPDASDAAAPAGDWNADDALATLPEPPIAAPVAGPEPIAVEPTPQATPYATPDAAALFGEGFDEEEVVIDRFASLESAFTATTPAVTNREDRSFSAEVEIHAVETHAVDLPAAGAAVEPPPPVESMESDAPVEADVTNAATTPASEEVDEAADDPMTVLALPQTLDDASTTTADTDVPEGYESDADVLIIERDPAPQGMPAAGAHRQEYRQLFANLRRS
ncbi:MAG: AAA family ATPase [Planctomycetota bacterium]